MEPKNRVIHTNLIGVVKALDSWSTESFQGFLESGLAHDFTEVVQKKDFNFKSTLCSLIEEYSGFSFCGGGVSISQTLKIISIAPSGNVQNWSDFFNLISYLGNNPKLFEGKAFSWEDRDSMRVTIGLDRINPVYKNDKGQDVVFKSAGHDSVWTNPPKGYRYAKSEEVPIEALVKFDGVVIKHEKSDRYRWLQMKFHRGQIHFDVVPDHVHFFHNYRFRIPIMKVE